MSVRSPGFLRVSTTLAIASIVATGLAGAVEKPSAKGGKSVAFPETQPKRGSFVRPASDERTPSPILYSGLCPTRF